MAPASSRRHRLCRCTCAWKGCCRGCNFTNVKAWEDFQAHIRTDANFVSPAFHNLTPEGVVALFKENGMRSVVERGDRAFPESHNAGDVVDTLLRACTLSGVRVVTDCEVKTIDPTPRGFSLDCVQTTRKKVKIPVDDPRKLKPGKPAPTREEITIEPVEYTCKKLIIATGGLSYRTWKQTLLPPPVGRMANTSRPSRASRIISSCMGRKLSYPQYVCSTSCGVIGVKDYMSRWVSWSSISF